jgi:hypothetical protein
MRPEAPSGSMRRAITTAWVAVLPRPPGHLAGRGRGVLWRVALRCAASRWNAL